MRILVTATVFLSFALDSFVRYPVPAPNEPHYLCKAKHYWNPAWCAGDFFLSSSNAHLVFFQSFGLLTRVCSLETTAIVGRILGLLVLAAGWTALVHAIVPGKWPPLWAAWIFLSLSAVGSLSGEWLVGGIEAKVIAYGLLFGTLAIWWQRGRKSTGRILAAGILIGIAISFHPVVGIWGLAAALFATVATAGIDRWRRRGAAAPPVEGTERVEADETFRSQRRWYLAAACAAAVAASPGICGGLKAAGGSSAAADYIQVYYRLAHHLDPMHFDVDSEHVWDSPWVGYTVLTVVWLAGRRWMSRTSVERWFFWFVVGTGLIAACGLADGWRSGPPEHMAHYALRWKFLKLYPFRLFDAMAPIAVAITVAGLARRWCEWACCRDTGGKRRTVGLIWIVCGVPALIAAMHVAPDARPSLTENELADWLDACRWIDKNTPTNALMLTPTQESWAFKWYAQRPEFVCYKDCPQDGPGIIAWNDRLLYVRDWAEKNFERGYTRADVAPLFRDKGITYIIAGRLGPFQFEPVYGNATFRVYRLDESAARRVER